CHDDRRPRFHTSPYVACIGKGLAPVNTVPYVMVMALATRRARRESDSGSRIGPEDWVRAGLSLLAQGGIDAVRVELLAARLGVTKGSFYWHFKDRADLRFAMLEAWRQLGTGDIIDRVEAVRGSTAEQLGRLIELRGPNKKAAGLETAVWAWAKVDGKAARALS